MKPANQPGPFISKLIDKSTDETYQRNYKGNIPLVQQLHDRLKSFSSVEGRPEDIDRHRKRGQLTCRERVSLLLDDDSPFLELFPFAGFGNKATPRTGMSGIGIVCGVECMICADVPTIRGGSKNEISVIGGLRALEISIKNRLPLINLIQTGGADLPQQHKVFHRGGETFRLLAQRSAAALPTLSVIFGSSTAGGAYHPGMSDYVIMVKGHAKVYLGGPPLVKMATGEVVSHEELGGATMHSSISGVSDFLAYDEPNALRIAREVVNSVAPAMTAMRTKQLFTLPLEAQGLADVDQPLHSAEELLGIVSPDVKSPFDMCEVIARIVDGSRMTFFKANYGKTLVCVWASIAGFPVGILANNGVLFSDASQKGAQFIHLCNQSNTPILFFHNITGFMVGKDSEQGGLIKHGSLMVNAVSNSTVPHISIIMGASFGAGNYAMCGRAYQPRFLFSYPNAKCSVMGSEQLSGVMEIVEKEKTAKMLKSMGDLISEDEKKEMVKEAAVKKEKNKKMVEATMDAYYTSGQVLDDGIIDPRDTRYVLAVCLSVVYNAEVKGGNIVGISRY